MTARAEPQLRVRAATIEDLDVVVALRVALLKEYADHPIYGRLRGDAATRARPFYKRQLQSTEESMFLAEGPDGAVGILRCAESVSSPLLDPPRYCYVSSVYVRPADRHTGVLRMLIAAAEVWCAGRGLDEIRLHNSTMHSDAVAAWDALGFEVVEQVRRRGLL